MYSFFARLIKFFIIFATENQFLEKEMDDYHADSFNS